MGIDSTLTGIPDFDKLEIVKVGSATVAGDNNSGGTAWKSYSTTIAHGLNYKPIIMGFVDSVTGDGFGTQNYRKPCPAFVYVIGVGTSWPVLAFAECMVDATNVYLRWLGNASDWTTQSVSFTYYLLRQRTTTS